MPTTVPPGTSTKQLEVAPTTGLTHVIGGVLSCVIEALNICCDVVPYGTPKPVRVLRFPHVTLTPPGDAPKPTISLFINEVEIGQWPVAGECAPPHTSVVFPFAPVPLPNSYVSLLPLVCRRLSIPLAALMTSCSDIAQFVVWEHADGSLLQRVSAIPLRGLDEEQTIRYISLRGFLMGGEDRLMWLTTDSQPWKAPVWSEEELVSPDRHPTQGGSPKQRSRSKKRKTRIHSCWQTFVKRTIIRGALKTKAARFRTIPYERCVLEAVAIAAATRNQRVRGMWQRFRRLTLAYSSNDVVVSQWWHWSIRLRRQLDYTAAILSPPPLKGDTCAQILQRRWNQTMSLLLLN